MISALFLDSRVNLTSCSACRSGPVVSRTQCSPGMSSSSPTASQQSAHLGTLPPLPGCATVSGREAQTQGKQTDGQARFGATRPPAPYPRQPWKRPGLDWVYLGQIF